MLMGIAIATVGLFVTQLTGNSVYDDIASIGVGIVLGVVAFALGADSRALLLGEAVPPEDEKRLRKIITFFDEVTDVLRLLTMHLGPNAGIHVMDGLDTDQIEELLERITKAMRDEMPEVAHTFIELHPLGGQVSRHQGTAGSRRRQPQGWRAQSRSVSLCKPKFFAIRLSVEGLPGRRAFADC